MFIYFIHILLAYSRAIVWIWNKQKPLLFSVGLAYVVGMFFLFKVIYAYEESITSYIVGFLEVIFSINMKDKLSFSNSFAFFLGIFSYRTCLLVMIMFVAHLLFLTLLLPLYYAIGLLMTNKILETKTDYSLKGLGNMYISLLQVIFYRGTWTMLYLFVLFFFSFFPYAGLLCAIACFLVVSHFLGHLFFRFAIHTANFNLIAVSSSDILKVSLLVGAFVVLSFLIPVIGWAFVPLIHLPVSIIIFQAVPHIKN